MAGERHIEELDVDPRVLQARTNLARWSIEIAAERKREFGFGYRPAFLAPSTLEELRTEVRSCQVTGLPLRVSNRYCYRTIYPGPIANVAFRFVHDLNHVFLDASFDVDGELLVASCHLARLAIDGFGNGTVEARLLFADTVGQTLFLAETGTFVADQLRFALRCLDGPLEVAIKAEALAQLGRAS